MSKLCRTSGEDNSTQETNPDLIELTKFIEMKTQKIKEAREEFRDLELDAANEMDEGIVIHKIAATVAPSYKSDSSASGPENNKLEFQSFKPEADWSNNKHKAEKLLDSLVRNIRMITQGKAIFEEQIELTQKFDTKLTKILTTSKKADKAGSISSGLFKRTFRLHNGQIVCFNTMVESCKELLALSGFLKEQVEALLKEIYHDNKVDKLMSSDVKKKIFAFIQIIKRAEVATRVIFVQLTCTLLARELALVTILMRDKKTKHSSMNSVDAILEDQAKLLEMSNHDQSQEDIAPITSPEKKLANSNESLIDQIRNSPKQDQEQTKKSMNTKFLRVDIINKMFLSFFHEWYINKYFEQYVSKKLQKKLNKDKPSFFDTFRNKIIPDAEDPNSSEQPKGTSIRAL
jgi:hypothetical protein